MKRDPEFMQEAIRQASIVYAALIGTGLLFVQSFLSAPSLDAASMTSVVAFAVAIPLLAALVIVNRQEIFRGRPSGSTLVSIARAVGQSVAFVGSPPGSGTSTGSPAW